MKTQLTFNTMQHPLLAGLLLLFAAPLWAQLPTDPDTPQSYPPMVSQGRFLGHIPALRDLEPVVMPPYPSSEKLLRKRNYFFPNSINNPHSLPQGADPLVSKPLQPDNSPELLPLFNFEGLHDPNGATPPDPTGDIGKNHYVQMVNSYGNAWLQVWDKHSGQPVYGPALTSTIWQQVAGVSSIGDPIVQYDAAAERWLIMEMQDFSTNGLLLAISDGPDPTGGWKAYAFQTLGFPDYPKLYVWNNAYFITTNEQLSGNVCSGFALEREALLAGAGTFKIYRFTMPNYLAIQYQPATGADWEAGPPPPPGSPGYIFRLYDDAWDGGTDHIQIWSVFVDWNDVAQSHIDGPQKVFPAPFETRVCWAGLFDCIEQPGPLAPRITALENIIMYRAPYRNFGDHESVVFNHVADVSGQTGDGGDAAVRWYELRKSGPGPWTIYQQGTYAPDLATNRFMGTISIDEAGNLGLGYTACSQQVYPGLRLTGRRAGDPLGTLPIQEYTLVAGAKSHQDERWGDYSSMAVDPEDGRTFWFTGEYQPAGAQWGTRIGSFRIQRDTYDVTPTLLKSPQTSAWLGNAEAVTVEIFGSGLEPATSLSVSLYFENALVVTDHLPGTLASGATLAHTFSQPVAMPVAGKEYAFRVVTHWAKDNFNRNDTLNTVVRKLTAGDASIVGQSDFPGIICGASAPVGLIIRNASGLPMTTVQLRWKINQQAEQSYAWSGYLTPGARDTLPLTIAGVVNGLNTLLAYTVLPNGSADQHTANDTLQVSFHGNLQGTQLTAQVQTDYGIIKWEMRALDGTPLVSGERGPGSSDFTVCTDDNTCYQFILRSQTLAWQGRLRLYDIFGKVLFEATEATYNPVTSALCTPIRYAVDVGPSLLLAPLSSPSLTAAEPVRIAVRNFGLQATNGIQVAYRLNGGLWQSETLPGLLVPGATGQFQFGTTENLSQPGGQFDFELRASVTGDEDQGNDTLQRRVLNRPANDLALESLHTFELCTDGDTTLTQASIVLRNYGLASTHTFKMQYSINGVSQPPQGGYLEIPTDQSETFYFSLQGIVQGQNNLFVDISQVNGLPNDDAPANDTASTGFVISPHGVQYILNMFTDDHPEQNVWQLANDQGQLLRTFGPYPAPYVGYVEYICLPLDSCFRLRLVDSAGDGMQGSASLLTSQQGVWVLTDNDFGSAVEVPFCVTYDCAELHVEAVASPDSAGTPLTDGTILAQATGGAGPYQYALGSGAFQYSPLFTGLAGGVYFLRVLDANFCATQREVFVDQTSAAQEPIPARALLASPNPTKGLVNLYLPARGDERAVTCEVYDSRGKMLQTARLTRWDDALRGVVALDNYPAGLYLLRLRGLNQVFSVRVVRE